MPGKSLLISGLGLLWRKLCKKPLLPSRFKLGVLGSAINVVALSWLLLIFALSFFPPVPVPLLTVAKMNWGSVMWSSIALLSLLYFVMKGRKQYVGPVEYVRRLE